MNERRDGKGGAMLKRLLPRSLFGRAIIIVVTPVILLQLVAAYVFYDRLLENVTERLARGVAGDIAFVTSALDRTPSTEGQFELLELATARMNLNFELLRGLSLTPPEQRPRRNPIEAVAVDTINRNLTGNFTIDNLAEEKTFVIDVARPQGVLRVLVPHNRMFARGTNVLMLWTVGSSLLLLAVAILFLRNQVRPIRRLAEAADLLGRGMEVRDFKPAGAAEVRQAADAFLRMRERIDRQIRQRTEMLAGVSHDLRTPLTRMRLALAMLGDSPDAEDLKADVADMERMIGGYLAFARGAAAETAEATDIRVLLDEVVADARRNGADIELHAESGLIVDVRQQGLRRCLANLLANAHRYAKHTVVSAGRQGKLLEITVDDDGPGVPAEEREAVFRPFYRLDPSRNPETGGVGLGLAIVRDTVRAQGGDVILSESPQGGLRATVRLPV